LVHDGLIRGPNSTCEVALPESHPTAKALEAYIVIIGDRRERRHSWALSCVASVILPHEGLNGCSRREADRAAECRPSRERHVQPTSARRSPQRPFVHAELAGEVIE
jgi:hypothetical protein